MGDSPAQSTTILPIVQAKIIPQQTKIYTLNPCQGKPIKIIKCGFENIPKANNTQEVLSLLKTIISKQESIEKRMEQIENSVFNTEILISKNVVERGEIVAKNQFKRECKVKVKRIHSVCRTTKQIEDDNIREIAAGFPLVSMDAISEVEQKLNGKKYYKSMVTYIQKFKDSNGSVDKVLRQLFTDTIIKDFNWDGRWGKKAINSLKLVDQLLFELFQIDGRRAFERHVKKYVELSHNRLKQKIRLENKIKQQHELLGYP